MSQETSMLIPGTRVRGLIIGLAAGDKNGGPQRMAMRIAESAVAARQRVVGASPRNSALVPQQPYDRPLLLCKYLSWYDPTASQTYCKEYVEEYFPKCFLGEETQEEPEAEAELLSGVEQPRDSQHKSGGEHKENWWKETEDSFDTGVVFYNVFRTVRTELCTGLGVTTPSASFTKPALTAQKTMRSRREFGELLDEAILSATQFEYKKRQSAGANPSHRNVVLACCPWIESERELASASRSETTITHLHPEAIETAVAVNILARQLIKGHSWQEALQTAATSPEVQSNEVREILTSYASALTQNTPLPFPTHTGGYSPKTLQSAMYFVTTATTFQGALDSSIGFAGPENYCPVIVGALCGAIYGLEGVESSDHLKHNRHFVHPRTHENRMYKVASELSKYW